MEMIPQAREIAQHAREEGKSDAADQVEKAINDVLERPEHKWFEEEKSKRDGTADNVKEILEKVVQDNPDLFGKSASDSATGSE